MSLKFKLIGLGKNLAKDECILVLYLFEFEFLMVKVNSVREELLRRYFDWRGLDKGWNVEMI